MTTAHGFVPILKHEKQADGTLIVEGIATDSGIDRDQQIADPGWLSQAMPTWFKSGGNIREQHDPKRAAGVAVEYAETDAGHHIRARVVDPITASKVEHGVLKGFSFGARNARVTMDKTAVGGRIIAGDIYEVSLVDRPANPRCTLTIAKADAGGELRLVDEPELVEEPTFTPADLARVLKALKSKDEEDEEDDDEEHEDEEDEVAKRDFSPKQRERAAEDGDALPDGSYPIANKGDLRNAIQAYGRAKDKARVKAHIVSRARALGALDQLPDDWAVSKALTALDVLAKYLIDQEATVSETDNTEKTDAAAKVDVIEKTDNTGDSTTDVTVTKTELTALIEDAITKAIQPYQERVDALKAEVAEVKALPQPGGPVRTRTTATTAVAQKADAHRREADRLKLLAEKIGDGVLAKGYRDLAELEIAKADALGTTS
jgi:hypothetical protein